ncbi:MAG: hypothetical protein K6G94_11330 [Kiritimatiellae bacterium]|jgi:hypothetical protein|nr:hypothetical protein [Kiritimatiellia bacterium]
MRKFLYAAAALALAGCSSYSEIARWNSDALTNDGEKPAASFMTQNFSYQLFGVIPLCTGLPWTEGDEDIKDEFNVRFFADEATIDNNLISLRHALDRVGGSRRVTQLHTKVDNDYFWSLFIVNRHEVRTQCLILQ